MILLYRKNTDSVADFARVLGSLPKGGLTVVSENRRSFVSLDKVRLSEGDILIASSPRALGMDNGDAAARLRRFMRSGIAVLLCSHSATYEYGISVQINRVALSAIIQSLEAPEEKKQKRTGRPKSAFPDGWEELYSMWDRKEISSREFILRSGLKRATFYNLLTEYKSLSKQEKALMEQWSADAG